ncbi:MAG: hypothetical protein GWN00_03500, partial [Aliifodinibius sp.]|nr:hypothetical protein [Fodinibius sp.]NIV10273.1 hypothetical protein [Fodinibius sp.]NIY23903.1 hypothetical protein [Fodinibius sp.]
MKADIKIIFIYLTVSLAAIDLFAQTNAWQWQNPLPQGNSLMDAFILDPNTVISVGNFGTIIKTTDGGVNWNIRHSVSGISEGFSSIYFVDSSRGWIVGLNGNILHTTDGG